MLIKSLSYCSIKLTYGTAIMKYKSGFSSYCFFRLFKIAVVFPVPTAQLIIVVSFVSNQQII
jgi:hypothetical protein